MVTTPSEAFLRGYLRHRPAAPPQESRAEEVLHAITPPCSGPPRVTMAVEPAMAGADGSISPSEADQRGNLGPGGAEGHPRSGRFWAVRFTDMVDPGSALPRNWRRARAACRKLPQLTRAQHEEVKTALLVCLHQAPHPLTAEAIAGAMGQPVERVLVLLPLLEQAYGVTQDADGRYKSLLTGTTDEME